MFLNNLDKIIEPIDFSEASKDEHCVSAMKDDIKALEDNKLGL